MAEINLLPIEFSPNGKSAKLADKIKKITLGLTVIFIFISVGGVGLIIFYSSQLKSSLAAENSLKQKIQSLEVTEQELFLLKDRIGKVKIAESEENASNKFIPLNTFLSSLPSGVVVNSIVLDVSKSEFSIVTSDTLAMQTFLNSLVQSKIYKNMTLKNFFFSEASGYTITLDVSI